MRGDHRSGLVAVTGASGGLGRALVARLLSDGQRVRALVRTERAASELVAAVKPAAGSESAPSVEVVLGDVRDEASLERLVAGAEVLHHLAAWMGKPAGAAERVNVDGTRSAVRAAVGAGVGRVVVASSVAVYGPALAGRVDESRPLTRVGDAYTDSKVGAEEAAFAAAAGTATGVVALRPTMIYGPASSSWTLTPLASIRRGLPVVLGDGSGLLDAVYVDDVARAFALAAYAVGVDGRAFNVVGAPISVADFMGAYGRMSGRSVRRVPLALARAGARAASLVTGALPGVDRVVPEMVEVMTSTARFDGSAAWEAFGYRAEVPFDEGMRHTARWLRSNGHLSGPNVVLVVGAGRGLGRCVAQRLADAYITTYAGDVDIGALTPSQALIPIELDATSIDSLADAVETIEASGHGPDAAVTTVGELRPGALEVQPFDQVERHFELNAFVPLRVARAVTPGMRRRGGGRIVNVSSTNGFQVTPFMGAYSAAKFALEALTDAMRQELAPFGVEVVLVQPAAMSTPFAADAKASLLRDTEVAGEPWSESLRHLHASDLWGEGGAASPDAVAEVVVKALLARRPPARVGSSPAVQAVKLFALLPDRLKDAYFSRSLRAGRDNQRSTRHESRERDSKTQAQSGPSR